MRLPGRRLVFKAGFAVAEPYPSFEEETKVTSAMRHKAELNLAQNQTTVMTAFGQERNSSRTDVLRFLDRFGNIHPSRYSGPEKNHTVAIIGSE